MQYHNKIINNSINTNKSNIKSINHVSYEIVIAITISIAISNNSNNNNK